MSPIRRTYVTINWILIIIFLLSLITFVVAWAKHDKKLKRRSGITCLAAFVLFWIAFAIECQFLGV